MEAFSIKDIPVIPTNLQIAIDKGKNDPLKYLKYGIWAYFLLLLFEGALRKWVLPGLSTPLLIVRDPIAVWLVYTSWKRNLLPSNIYLNGVFIVGVLATITALAFGHGSFPVAVYGARILLFHFPLIFVIGSIFTPEDVKKLGRVTVWITIPMLILIAMQFYSPQSAFVNRGVGGDMKGGGFDGAMGFFRPPATFSFTNGTSLFFGFSAAFIFYFWLTPKSINRLLLIAATVCILASIPLSISRSLLSLILASIVFTLIAVARNPRYLLKMVMACVVVFMLIGVLSEISFFKTPLAAFTNRFTNANKTEGGVSGVVVDRFLGGMLVAIYEADQKPFFGYGIGMGTSVGAQLIAGDSKVYLISEGEWGRLIGEMGIIFGFTVIILRIALTISMAVRSYRKLSSNDFLPWMLCSIGLLAVMQGQWAQPTSLGFIVVMGGLILAALREPKRKMWLIKQVDDESEEELTGIKHNEKSLLIPGN